jgi:hypothetical protein
MQKNLPDNSENSTSSHKSSPSPFIGAAGMVLNAGKAVLGLIGKGISGSVRILTKRRPTMKSGSQSDTFVKNS